MVPKRDRDRACHPHEAIEHVGNLGWLSFGVGSRKNPNSVAGYSSSGSAHSDFLIASVEMVWRGKGS